MAGRRAAAVLFAAVLAGAAAAAAGAQEQRPFLYLNEERILTGSRKGQALLDEEEKARDMLRAEARAIEAAFEAEERKLNGERAGMKPEDFRKLADDFDARVVEARQKQDERANALAQEFDQKRRQFYAEVGPLLVGLMQGRGAVAILDESSVLLADQSINVTDEVIAAIDAPGTPVEQGAPTPQPPALAAEPTEAPPAGATGAPEQAPRPRPPATE